jgi:hypothetical protein
MSVRSISEKSDKRGSFYYSAKYRERQIEMRSDPMLSLELFGSEEGYRQCLALLDTGEVVEFTSMCAEGETPSQSKMWDDLVYLGTGVFAGLGATLRKYRPEPPPMPYTPPVERKCRACGRTFNCKERDEELNKLKGRRTVSFLYCSDFCVQRSFYHTLRRPKQKQPGKLGPAGDAA